MGDVGLWCGIVMILSLLVILCVRLCVLLFCLPTGLLKRRALSVRSLSRLLWSTLLLLMDVNIPIFVRACTW